MRIAVLSGIQRSSARNYVKQHPETRMPGLHLAHRRVWDVAGIRTESVEPSKASFGSASILLRWSSGLLWFCYVPCCARLTTAHFYPFVTALVLTALLGTIAVEASCAADEDTRK
jgi:hypothetical protein